MVETFSALAEPNRFRIVELLRSGPQPVNDISARLRLNQPQVSKHLRVLKAAGLVDVTPRAQQRLYQLRAPKLRRLHEWLDRYRRVWDERLAEIDELIKELGEAEICATDQSSSAKRAESTRRGAALKDQETEHAGGDDDEDDK
jgi:DNA-binding transcriptional ArsR family regulator